MVLMKRNVGKEDEDEDESTCKRVEVVGIERTGFDAVDVCVEESDPGRWKGEVQVQVRLMSGDLDRGKVQNLQISTTLANLRDRSIHLFPFSSSTVCSIQHVCYSFQES